MFDRLHPLRRWAVAAVGTVLSGVTVGAATVASGQGTFDQLSQFGLPFVLALVVAGFGAWLVRADFSAAQIQRVARWTLAGVLVLGLFSLWEVYLHTLEGETLLEALHELLHGTAEGAAVGTVVGYYDSRRLDQIQEIRRSDRAISASADGIAVLDEAERYTKVNQAHADIYGYDDPDAFLGETWRMCYTDAELARIEDEVFPELAETGHWQGELTGLRRDGTTFPQEISLTTLDDGGLVCIVRDITGKVEQKEQIAALHDASRRLTDATTPQEVAAVTVEIASRVLDKPLSTMWFYDGDRDCLTPAARTDSTASFLRGADIADLGDIGTDQLGMDVYRSEEMRIIDDYAAVENPAFPELPLGTVVIVPVGDYGILELGAESVEEVTETERHQIEILATNARVALERAEREQELARREHRLRTIVENVPVILFAFDRDRTLTLQVGKGLDDVGISQNEHVGEPVDEVFGETSAIVDAVERSLDGESVDVTLDIRGRTYQVWCEPVGAGGGQNVIGVAMDVTDQQKRERGIRALHDATREMMQETDRETICQIAADTAQNALGLPVSGIWLYSEDRHRLEPAAWSTQAEALFDELPVFEPGEGISWTVFEEGTVRVFDDVSTDPDRYNPETEMRSELIVPVGEYGVLTSGSTVSGRFDETDVALAQLLAANTRSALERADREADLQQQTDQMEFFNSILRHDVLNGMTVIRGRAEFLAEELEGEALRDAETIVDWSNDVVAIVQRVRTVLETLTGTGDPELEPTDLSAAIRSELDRVAATYDDISFESDIPDGVTVQANELLSEVLGNLITNAVEHNEQEGLTVSVSVSEPDTPGDPVTVRIADTGEGVPDELKEAIFRRENTGHAKSTGSGFGLFFVDSMLDEYGGDVWVEDTAPHGATFVVELPTP